MADLERKKKRLDMNELAHRVVQQATADGEDDEAEDKDEGERR